MTGCAILYASPVPTVKLFDPVPINKDVTEDVKYLSPSCPAVPLEALVPLVPAVPVRPDVPAVPVNPDVPDVPVIPDVPAVAS